MKIFGKIRSSRKKSLLVLTTVIGTIFTYFIYEEGLVSTVRIQENLRRKAFHPEVHIGDRTSQDVLNEKYNGDRTSQDVLNEKYNGDRTSQDVLNEKYIGDRTSQDVLNEKYNGDRTSQDAMSEKYIGDRTGQDVTSEKYNGGRTNQDVLSEKYNGDRTSQDVLNEKYNGDRTGQDVTSEKYNGDRTNQDVMSEKCNCDRTNQDVMSEKYNGDRTSQDAMSEKYNGDRTSQDVMNQKYNGDRTGQDVISRFSARRQHVENVCKNKNDFLEMKNQSRAPMIMPVFFHHYDWCGVPKVGFTFVQVLNRRIKRGRVKLQDESTRKGLSRDKRKSFFVVREPYSRLVSAYVDKLVTNQQWWIDYGKFIVQNMRVNATSKAKDCGSDVTFPEFIKFFIYSQTKDVMKNWHFTPIHEVCDPCYKSYDFTLHLETLTEDLSYLLGSANISTDTNYSDEEMTIKAKASRIISQKEGVVRCETMCSALRTIWWSFHIRGLVAPDIPFPLKTEQECDSISKSQFISLSLEAHERSVGRKDKRKQKRQALVSLFLQVPLKDRLEVRDLLTLDCELFGYDPQPDDLFPELV